MVSAQTPPLSSPEDCDRVHAALLHPAAMQKRCKLSPKFCVMLPPPPASHFTPAEKASGSTTGGEGVTLDIAVTLKTFPIP